MKQPHQTLRALPMRAIAVAVAATLTSMPAFANPNGATVTSGSATISTSGSTMTVTNSPNTIINWHDFSIGTGETTRFIQQSATSAVLNRVTGGDPSLILGTLQSNGRVFLINPSGIIFGVGSVVDVGGLVASTLNITDEDFLAGKHVYNADTTNPGNVVNAGEIRTPNGGFVYLIGTHVENSGVINTPSGEAILAAGHSVEIVDSTDPALRVIVRAQSQDVNLSQLMLQNDGNIFSVLNSGRVSANTVTQDATGKIYFKSAGSVETTASSITEAKGSETLNGGYFQGFAGTTGTYAGTIDASGRNGGFAETSGATVDFGAFNLNLRALSAEGKGGHWLIDPTDITINGALASTIETQLGANVDVTINTFAAGTDAGNITVASSIFSYGSDVTLTLQANNNITVNSGVTILAAGGDPLNLVFQADADGNGTGGIKLDYDTPGSVNLSTDGGYIVMGGGSNPLTGLAQSILLENVNINTGGGNLTLNGSSVTINDGSFISAGNLAIKGGSSGVLISDSVQLLASGTGSINTTSMTMDDNSEIVVQGALSVNASGTINIDSASIDGGVTSGLTQVNANAMNITDTQTSDESYITGANGLSINVTNGFLIDSGYLEGGDSSGATTINAGSLTILDTYGSNSNSITAGNGLSINVRNAMNISDSTEISDDGGSLINITVGGALNVDDSTITATNDLTIKAGATTLTDSTFDSGSNLNLTVGSLSMTRSTVGDSSGMTPTNINITSNGNVVLNDGSDIVADQEVRMLVGGRLYLNSGGSGESHISTFSNNTIYLTFPTLFSGGYFMDGVEGVLFSSVNPFTGFFTGSSLDTLAILNTNLFITYAPAGALTNIVGQTTTTTQVTNPYLDPFGTGTTGPGDSSYLSEVDGYPYPSRSPFAEVQECR